MGASENERESEVNSRQLVNAKNNLLFLYDKFGVTHSPAAGRIPTKSDDGSACPLVQKCQGPDVCIRVQVQCWNWTTDDLEVWQRLPLASQPCRAHEK